MVALWAPLLNAISKWHSVLSPYGCLSSPSSSSGPSRVQTCPPGNAGLLWPVAESFPLSRQQEAQLAGCLLGLVPAAALQPFLQSSGAPEG